MTDVDPRRARSFGGVAGAYRRARPSYPPAAVRWVLDWAPGPRVVDLAAGTGKLTEVLRAEGADVVAVEPLDRMREQLRAAVPGVAALAGAAEAIPLPDASADAVTVAQAFHWFRTDEALTEIGRVLVPAGVVGLLWNMRDDGVGWVRELTERLGGAGDTLSESRRAGEDDLRGSAFAGFERREFPNPEPFDRERLVAWSRSTSSIATLPANKRERLLADVAALCDEHPDLRGRPTFSMPFVTVVLRARRP